LTLSKVEVSNKIAVIGIGNTLRRDDGIGIIILDSLLKFHKREEVDYLNFGIASFDMLHRIQDYDVVLLIDGMNASVRTGELKIFTLEDIKYTMGTLNTSTHELSLKNIFDLCRNFGLKTKIYVAGIQVGDTSYGESISEPLKKQLDKIVREVCCFIDKNLCVMRYQAG